MLVPASAAAAEAAPAAATPRPLTRRLVDVHLAGDASAVAAVESVLRERISTADRRVGFDAVPSVDPAAVVTPGPTSDAQLARVWVDLRGDARFTVYIVDGAWERVLVRHLARRANPEVAFEEIGHIVELALDALSLGERIGIGRDAARAELLVDDARLSAGPAAIAAPPPRDTRAASDPRPSAFRSRTRLDAGIFCAMTAYSGSLEVATGPGVIGSVHRVVTSRVALGASLAAQYALPSDADARSARVRLESGAVTALASATWAPTALDTFALGVGGGAELVRASLEEDASRGIVAGEPTAKVRPLARALLRYQRRLGPVALFAGVGVDVPLHDTRYVIARPGGARALLEPWSARPFVLAGVALP